jgi:RHS repeat-associated protein
MKLIAKLERYNAYSGNYIYENSSLKFIQHSDGYLEPTTSSSYKYIYHIKDHLSNVRLGFSDSNSNGNVDVAEITDEKNYYPFGLNHEGYNVGIDGVYYPYGFNGKEENLEIGLNWLDFSARNYNSEIGRWMNLDPKAELMRRHSPYNYAFDNPIFFIDPDGMAPFAAGCCGGVGNQIEQGFKNKIGEIKRGFEDFKKEASKFFANGGNSIEEFFNKLSGGEGSGGIHFTSDAGEGDQDRQGGRDVEQVDGDVILNAATIGGTGAAPLNKTKIPDFEVINTVFTGLDKGGSAMEAAMDEFSSTSVSSNNEHNVVNQAITIRLHTKHPSYGFVDGQLMNSGSTSFRDTTVTFSTVNRVIRSNDSIQMEKERAFQERFINTIRN